MKNYQADFRLMAGGGLASETLPSYIPRNAKLEHGGLLPRDSGGLLRKCFKNNLVKL